MQLLALFAKPLLFGGQSPRSSDKIRKIRINKLPKPMTGAPISQFWDVEGKKETENILAVTAELGRGTETSRMNAETF